MAEARRQPVVKVCPVQRADAVERLARVFAIVLREREARMAAEGRRISEAA